jgi:hypothetical protein
LEHYQQQQFVFECSNSAEMRGGQRAVHGDAATALDVQPSRYRVSSLCAVPKLYADDNVVNFTPNKTVM